MSESKEAARKKRLERRHAGKGRGKERKEWWKNDEKTYRERKKTRGKSERRMRERETRNTFTEQRLEL